MNAKFRHIPAERVKTRSSNCFCQYYNIVRSWLRSINENFNDSSQTVGGGDVGWLTHKPTEISAA